MALTLAAALVGQALVVVDGRVSGHRLAATLVLMVCCIAAVVAWVAAGRREAAWWEAELMGWDPRSTEPSCTSTAARGDGAGRVPGGG